MRNIHSIRNLRTQRTSGGSSSKPLIDEDNMASNSATAVPSQQSVKAYVDAEIAGVEAGAGIGFDGSTADGILTYKDADEASVEANLTYKYSASGTNPNLIVGSDHGATGGSNAGTILQLNRVLDAEVFSVASTGQMELISGGALVFKDSPTTNLSADSLIRVNGENQPGDIGFAKFTFGSSVHTNTIAVKTRNDNGGATLTLGGGSITDSSGTIDFGDENLTTSGTVQFGSLSDGVVTITDIANEDNMSSNSEAKLATQQSIKAYVDSVASGLDVKDSCVAATIASFTMASTASGTTLVLADDEGGFDADANTYTLDGQSIVTGKRVLIKDGVNSNGSGISNKWNGIYIVGSLTESTLTLTRSTDFQDATTITSGAFTFIETGAVNDNKGFVLTTDTSTTAPVLGVTLFIFAQFSTSMTAAERTKLNAIEAAADVTDTANVTAAGALMDSELTDLAGVKGVTISTLQVKPSEGAFANGDKTKLNAIEASADVTDTANVTAAGALMDSELTDLAGVKGVTISTLQVKPSEGAFANGDKTKLNAIEASADVTDAANVAAAGAVMNTGNETIAGIKTFTSATPLVFEGATGDDFQTTIAVTDPTADRTITLPDASGTVITTTDVTNVGSGAIITSAERTKLNAIEAAADVTDTANVTAAGALMDSELTDLAGVKGVTISTLQVKPSEGAFANGDKTKLNAIEASADVTDTANVTAAGALMDSELTDLAGVKGVTISTLQVKPSEGAFANGDKTKLNAIEASADVTDAANVAAAGAVMNTGNETIAGIKTFTSATPLVFEGATGDDFQTTIAVTDPTADRTITLPDASGTVITTTDVTNVGSGAIITSAERTKLNAIEAAADVTDTANVTAAGALMDSELTDLAGVKGVTISTLQVKPSEGAFANGDKTKLNAIEASADVTDTANVTAAGALMDSELTDLAGVKGVTISTLQVKPSEGAFANGDKTKLNAIEASADVTDAANVAAAGAVMNTGNETIAGIKTFTSATPLVFEGATGDDFQTTIAVTDPTADRTITLPDASGTVITTTDVTNVGSGAIITSAERTKLNAIEAAADVTDTANVTAAGALMDSELTDLAGVKGVTISTLQVKPSEGAFANGDKTKLNAIEASADVTDTANVTAAGH